MKIKQSSDDMSSAQTSYDVLDMTRIHIESYAVAIKVAWDAYCDKDKYENKNVPEFDKMNAVRQVISNTAYLTSLDI
jgi:transcriptional accessory protein Tex/SPT6